MSKKKYGWGVVTAVASSAMLLMAGAGTSFAVVPGEGNWIQEGWTARGTMNEARVNNNLAQVWRSDDNLGNVWMRWNNGTFVNLGGTTFDSPTVVAIGNQFMAFHTGNNHQIYMMRISGPNSQDRSAWVATGIYSNRGPSVAQLGSGNNQLYMTWISNDDRGAIYGSYYNGITWGPSQAMGGQTDGSAPSVTFNEASNRIFASHTGTDRQTYVASQNLGSSQWSGWTTVGGEVVGPSGFAATPYGTMQLAGRAPDGEVWFEELDAAGNPVIGWQPNRGGYASQWPVGLSSNGTDIYALLTGYSDGKLWYKTSFREGSF